MIHHASAVEDTLSRTAPANRAAMPDPAFLVSGDAVRWLECIASKSDRSTADNASANELK